MRTIFIFLLALAVTFSFTAPLTYAEDAGGGGNAGSKNKAAVYTDDDEDSGEPRSGNWEINLGFLVGVRKLVRENYWGNAKDADLLQVSVDFGKDTWPVSILAGMSFAGSKHDTNISGTKYKTTTFELYGGVRKYFRFDNIQPYISGGITSMSVRRKSGWAWFGSTYKGSSVGYFVDAGTLFKFDGGFQMGIELRHVGGTNLSLGPDNVDTNGNYNQAGVIFGYGW